MMEKIFTILGLSICFTGVMETAIAARLNEWTFEKDPAGLTLSQATNSGTDSAVFSNGGTGFLETDGLHSLLCTHSASGTNDMWTDGAILDAAMTNTASAVHFLRYDFNWAQTAVQTNGAVLGVFVVDSMGNHLAGVAAVRGDVNIPAGRTAVPVATNLSGGSCSVIVKVDMSSRTLAVWYDLAGSNVFDENNPATNNVPVNLTSIDQLRFQATGDFRPAGSMDYVAVNNIRTASTWGDIAAPLTVPLTVHPLFHDNMVLQRDMDVPVWGRVTPGAAVAVKLDGVTVGTAVADADGQWLAKLAAHAHDGGLPHVILISSSGEQTVQINEVVFGDVYLASGQSNMDGLMNYSSTTGFTGYAEEMVTADAYPLIRQVSIFRATSATAQDEPSFRTNWTKCSTASLPNFTATGYWFAKNVYLKTGVPVGLIACAWGGQSIDRFLCPAGAAAVPELAGMMQYQEQGMLPNLYDIYNAMIAPLIPYGVRGAVWYQGEANANDKDIYRNKMQALMRGWRQNWGQGAFPFYYVQLANYQNAGDYPGVREAQAKALSETNTGMAVTIDIGDPLNIHPANKPDVGRRLAQWALAKDFHQDIVCSGPLYRNALVEGSQIRVIFDYAENGLITGWKSSTNPVVAISGPLQNFEIAGSNKTFVSATAVIDKNTVVVSSPQITEPVYVRYCYTNAPAGTNKLYNAAGLPASPFRTDESYRLDVRSGSGTAIGLMAGARVSITATAPAAGKVFDRWIGAASEIDHLNASPATVTMPAHSLFLLAAYRDNAAPTYTNIVNNGSGDGTSQAGSILNIEADAPSAGRLFDHWSGDTQTVVNARSSNTTLRMPTNNVTVTAVFRTVDSVGDGIADAWRTLYFTGDGTTTNDQSAAGADPDGDGMNNLQEFQAGTSPVDSHSVLRLGGSVSSGTMTLKFPSTAGRRYGLEATDSLTAPDWQTVLYNISGDGNQKVAGFSTGAASNGFYRLLLITE
ncbi:MAG: sialate O-acetylesterase [Kiritimatiellales bacterium]